MYEQNRKDGLKRLTLTGHPTIFTHRTTPKRRSAPRPRVDANASKGRAEMSQLVQEHSYYTPSSKRKKDDLEGSAAELVDELEIEEPASPSTCETYY